MSIFLEPDELLASDVVNARKRNCIENASVIEKKF